MATKPAGTTATPNQLIESSKFNSVIDDIYALLNAALPITAVGTSAVSKQGAVSALFDGTTIVDDDNFTLAANGDQTKLLSLDLSGLTTATKRTWTAPDKNGTVALTSDLAPTYATTATTAGTTVLTVDSAEQQYFTGTTTQTVVLPVTSTLVLGQSYRVVNNSTGAVTVQSSGANAIVVIPAGRSVLFTCILLTGTTAASWDYQFVTAGMSFSASPAAVAGYTFTGLPTSVRVWRLDVINLKPATDNDNIYVRASASGTPVASGYEAGMNRSDYSSATLTNQNGNSQFIIAGTVGNDTNEGASATLFITNLGQAAYTHLTGSGTLLNSAGGTRLMTCGGTLKNTTAYTELNIICAGGNIASGDLLLTAVG